MVLWEVTLATAYFLGLKRTYKLALRLQRRLISPRHPRIRNLIHRRIRGVFDVAVTVHRRVQERDLEVGRSLGNWILYWLDRMKPSAKIRCPRKLPTADTSSTMELRDSNQLKITQKPASRNPEPPRTPRLLSTWASIQSRSLPTLRMMMMMRSPRSIGIGMQCRHMHCLPRPGSSTFPRSRFQGVYRWDIMFLMSQS